MNAEEKPAKSKKNKLDYKELLTMAEKFKKREQCPFKPVFSSKKQEDGKKNAYGTAFDDNDVGTTVWEPSKWKQSIYCSKLILEGESSLVEEKSDQESTLEIKKKLTEVENAKLPLPVLGTVDRSTKVIPSKKCELGKTFQTPVAPVEPMKGCWSENEKWSSGNTQGNHFLSYLKTPESVKLAFKSWNLVNNGEPIFQKGNKHGPDNYRKSSLNSIFMKEMYSHEQDFHLLDKKQNQTMGIPRTPGPIEGIMPLNETSRPNMYSGIVCGEGNEQHKEVESDCKIGKHELKKELNILGTTALARTSSLQSCDSGYSSRSSPPSAHLNPSSSSESNSSCFAVDRDSDLGLSSTTERHCVCPPPDQHSILPLNSSVLKNKEIIDIGTPFYGHVGGMKHTESLNYSAAGPKHTMQSFCDAVTNESDCSVFSQTSHPHTTADLIKEGTEHVMEENKEKCHEGFCNSEKKKFVAGTDYSMKRKNTSKSNKFFNPVAKSQDLFRKKSLVDTKNPYILMPSKALLQMIDAEQPDEHNKNIKKPSITSIRVRKCKRGEQEQNVLPSNVKVLYIKGYEKDLVPPPCATTNNSEPSSKDMQGNKSVSIPVLNHTNPPGEQQLEPKASSCVTPKPAGKPLVNVQEVLQESKRKLKTFTVCGELYVKKKCIGAGGSAKVYEVEDSNGKIFAVKVVQFADVDSEIAKGYLNEVNLLEQMRGCPYVVQLYQWEIRDEDLYILMEKGSSDLAHIIKTKPKLQRRDILLYWNQMLKAVNSIHKAGIIHLDLKPNNFLLVEGRLKLIDFGIANKMQSDLTSITRQGQAGTMNYMAPEQLLNVNNPLLERLSPKTDVWGLACILYCMIYRTLPYKHIRNDVEKKMAITSGQLIKFDTTEHQDLVDILKACLKFRAKDRVSIEDLLRHPCFAELNDTIEEDFQTLPKTPIRNFAQQVKRRAVNSPRSIKKIDRCFFPDQALDNRD